MKRAALAILIVVVFHPRADAVVVSGTNVVFGSGTGPFPPGGNYFGTIYQDVAGTDPTSVLFDFTNGTLRITISNVDQGSDWYFVHAGDQFGPATIAANQFVAVPISPQAPYPIGNGDFYLGIATSDAPNFPFVRDIFGWVQIHDASGTLSATGNAVSYHSQGIVVGTINEVPEPSTIVMAGLAVAMLFVCQRRLPRQRALVVG